MTIGRKELTEQVIKLLKRYSAKSESAIAIAIDGEWGVGKSHMYRKDLASEIGKKLEKPIYTSVFGKKDENEIIQDLLMQLITREKKSTETIAKLSNWIINPIITTLSEGTIPSIDTSFIFRAFEKKDLENSIICIDDFERLSSKIPIEDVLGLISELKENKGCHIILLCNENMISENHKEKFKEYREKIIDKTFQYKPTPIEQFDLVKDLLAYSVESEKNSKDDIDDIKEILHSYHAENGVLELKSINLREIKKVIHCFNDYCDGLENNQMLKDTRTRILFTNIVLWFLFCYTKVRPLERELEELNSKKIELKDEVTLLEKKISEIGGDYRQESERLAIQKRVDMLRKNIISIDEEITIKNEKVTHEKDRLGHFKPQIPFLTLVTDFLPSLFKEYDKNNVFTFRNDQKKYQTYLSNEETFISILSEIARQYRFQKEYNALSANKQNSALEASKDFFNQHGSSSSVWFMLGYRPQNWNPKFFSEKPFESSLIGNNPQYKEKIQELIQEAFNKAEDQNNHWLNQDRYKREIEAFLKKKGIELQ